MTSDAKDTSCGLSQPDGLAEMAGHVIRRLHQHSTQVFQQTLKASGIDLTPVQFAALYSIQAEPGLDQATLAARIAYDRATLGGVVDRLETKGWISRAVSRSDRRARTLQLTAEGTRVLERALPLVTALQASILNGLSEAETETFLHLARKALSTKSETTLSA